MPRGTVQYNQLQNLRLTVLTSFRIALPHPYLLTLVVWSVGGCNPLDHTLCPEISVSNDHVGMELPVLTAAIRDSMDAFHVMSYYTGLENNAAKQKLNTVNAVASHGIAKSKIFGGVMADGQYTDTTAAALSQLLRADGYHVFLWDLKLATKSMVEAIA